MLGRCVLFVPFLVLEEVGYRPAVQLGYLPSLVIDFLKGFLIDIFLIQCHVRFTLYLSS